MQSSSICVLAVCAFVLISSLSAAPLDDSQHATILRYDNDNIGTDGYNFGWVKRREKGKFRSFKKKYR